MIRFTVLGLLLCLLSACGTGEFFIKRGVNGLQQDVADEFCHSGQTTVSSADCFDVCPVREKMVEHTGECFWSSYRANAPLEASDLISPNDSYLALGSYEEDRQKQYREIFKSELYPTLVGELRVASNSNCALGYEKFKAEIEGAIGRRAPLKFLGGHVYESQNRGQPIFTV